MNLRKRISTPVIRGGYNGTHHVYGIDITFRDGTYESAHLVTTNPDHGRRISIDGKYSTKLSQANY